MIVFVTTSRHVYTHEQVVATAAGFEARVLSYEQLFNSKHFPAATYVFTDMDRLSLPALGRASRCCRQLRARGLRVLNDPARFRTRAGLLRRLYQLGINGFDAYRVEDNCQPRRWPVFLRAEGTHGAPLSDLLHDPAALTAAITRAVKRGVPVSALIVVEYSAEPVAPGIFRKLSVFRIGNRSVATTCAHDDHWIVKYGKKGIASEELYRDELRIVTHNPYGPALQRAFEIGGIDYGRVDFGLVDSRVQVYEINSNPQVKFADEHPSPLRVQSYRVFKQNYLEALRLLDAQTTSTDAAVILANEKMLG